jgi:hypothetical protein
MGGAASGCGAFTGYTMSGVLSAKIIKLVSMPKPT